MARVEPVGVPLALRAHHLGGRLRTLTCGAHLGCWPMGTGVTGSAPAPFISGRSPVVHSWDAGPWARGSQALPQHLSRCEPWPRSGQAPQRSILVVHY